MTNRTPILVALSVSVALAGAACSSDRATRNATNGNDGSAAAGGGDNVTVAGCLSGGPDGRMVLTAAPDPGVTAPARVGMGGERDTNSYVLVGGQDLQRHIGKRVEVTGTLARRTQELERESKTQAESPAATSGRETPTVKTKTEVDVEVRQLNVSAVREVAPSCQINP